MKSNISVEINDISVSIEAGATLGDILKKTKTTYIQGTTIGIIKGGEEKGEQTTEYSVSTNKGEFKIGVDPEKHDLINAWTKNIINKKLRAHWATNDAVAFGPIETDIKPDRGVYDYQKYEVIMGAGGYDAKNTYIVLSKDRHASSYGSPVHGGVFARIISGKNIISKLEHGDTINQIEPVIRWETLTDKIITSDLDTPLEQGMKIFTYFSVDLKKDAPLGAERFLGLVRHGIFHVSDISSSYVVDDTLKSEESSFEILDSRSEGSVALRIKGEGLGRMFIQKEDRTSSVAHSIVGNVTKGIELVKLAEKNNKLHVMVNPNQVMFLGLSIEESETQATKRGIDLEIGGYEAEDAIVAEQRPETTMEILEKKKVSLFCIPPEQLIHVKFYHDKAPKTIEFLRHALKLKERPLGPLPVHFTYANTTLFKTIKRAETYKEIMPENTPTEIVRAGEIGVTNQASKMYGIVGVKNTDDNRYGPTGEKFNATNIIGKVIDAEKLAHIQKDDIIYVVEVE